MKRLFLIWLHTICGLVCFVASVAAGDNPLVINVNASGDDYGANTIYTEIAGVTTGLEVEWKEKAYYGAETGEYFHPCVTIENSGDDGFLIVKIDVLQYTTFLKAETYYLGYSGNYMSFPDLNTTGEVDINNPKSLTLTRLCKDQKIAIFDYLDRATHDINDPGINGPVIITAMLYKNNAAAGVIPISWSHVELLGVDVQHIFINTDFSKWMQ